MIDAVFERLGRAWRKKSIREACLLFFAAWAARLGFMLALAKSVGFTCRNLALMYDGHIYILIARSAPFFYRNIHLIFPRYHNSKIFAGFFPVYPAIIALVGLVVKDLRVAALAASQILSSLAVVAFYFLARKTTRRPFLAALLFCFFPAAWLLAGSLAFAESAYVLLFIVAIYFFIQERFAWAVFFAAFVVVAQKSGLLILPVFATALWLREGPRAVKRLPWVLPLAVPALLFHAYLWKVYGSPWIDIQVQREMFSHAPITFPFRSLAAGLSNSTQIFSAHFWPRKSLIGASCLFYASVCAWGWKKRRAALDPLLIWLSVGLLFNVSLNGPWGYYAFPRYMTLAAPPAILLCVDLLPSWPRHIWALLLAAAFGLCFWTALVDARDFVDLMYRVWPAGYFDSLVSHLI